MPCFCLLDERESIRLNVKAFPGASRTQLAGVQGERLRVHIAAAPENGKANAALCAFLAKALGCSKADVVLQSGEKSRLKTIIIPAALKDKLEKLLETC
jgi:uncharacterized protein (TIGR00251 family)